MPVETEFLSTFRFDVTIEPSGGAGDEGLARTASFHAVSGLEINVEAVELREGGYNEGLRRLVGKTSHPMLVLKRGMTRDRSFWDWVQACFSGTYPLPYVSGTVVQYPPTLGAADADGAKWRFVNGLATAVKGSELAAVGPKLPIEELHIAHEGLTRVVQ